MFKPWHTLLFGLIFFLALGLLSFFFPSEGVFLTAHHSLKFPTLPSFYKDSEQKTDISQILKSIESLESDSVQLENQAGNDSLFLVEFDSLQDQKFLSKNETIVNQKNSKIPELLSKRDSVYKLIADIQTKNPSALQAIFDALYNLSNKNSKQIRVLHYGDSQIEGDRITSFLRQKLQAQFGGEGPGLLSLMPLAPSVINKISNSNNWDRYNAATVLDKRVLHKNFGVMAGFTRYAPYKKLADTSATISASVMITTTKLGGSIAMAYKKVKLFYGGSRRKTWCEFYDGPALMAADSLEAWGMLKVKEYNVGYGSFTHTFKFKGKDSPDFYCVSLQSDHGVMVDNIALRGSSGTFFHHINPQQLKQFYDLLNVKLIILQFGGNALPSIQNEQMIANYSSYLRGQITMVKRAAPNASILFIGPSDMDIKDGTDYITHPYLEMMRDAIKKVVLESNCAFYDMYDAMGGRNSMSAWVDENLAARDYIHFSPKGAKKAATLIHAAFMKEYNNYIKTKK